MYDLDELSVTNKIHTLQCIAVNYLNILCSINQSTRVYTRVSLELGYIFKSYLWVYKI